MDDTKPASTTFIKKILIYYNTKKKFLSILKKSCTFFKIQFIIKISVKKRRFFVMFNNKIKEECGVFGVYSKKPERLAYMTCVGLSGLQHRGEESCRYCCKYRWSNFLS